MALTVWKDEEKLEITSFEQARVESKDLVARVVDDLGTQLTSFATELNNQIAGTRIGICFVFGDTRELNVEAIRQGFSVRCR